MGPGTQPCPGAHPPGGILKDYVCDDDYKPLIPNGTYEAECIKYDNKFVFNTSRKTFLKFRVVGGEHEGKVIFMAYNMPYQGRIKTGSKYYKDWVFVNNWNRPSKNAKMSPRLFFNKLYKIRTRTCIPKRNGQEMPEEYWYSVVDEIIEVIAG